MSNTWTIEQMGMTITTDGAWIVIRSGPVDAGNDSVRCVIVANDCFVRAEIHGGRLSVRIDEGFWDFWLDVDSVEALEEEFLAKIIQAKHVARAFDRGR